MAPGPTTQPAYVLWLVALLVCALICLVAGIGAQYRSNQRAVWAFAVVFVVCLGAVVVLAMLLLWGTP